MPVAPGTSAPSAEARTVAGGDALDLEALAARGPALLFFFKGDCAASEASAHALARLAAIPGLTVVAISQDPQDETLAFAEAHGLGSGIPLLVDPEPWPASVAYGVVATPTWILLAPGARVEAVAEGWSRDDANALAARAAALAGQPAPMVSTAGDGPDFRPG